MDAIEQVEAAAAIQADNELLPDVAESPLMEQILAAKRRIGDYGKEREQHKETCRLIALPRKPGKHLVHEIPTHAELSTFLHDYVVEKGLTGCKQGGTELRIDLHKHQSLTRYTKTNIFNLVANAHVDYFSLFSNTQYWLDISHPTEAALDLLSEHLGFHPLSVEDCLHKAMFKGARTHRQKVEAFENYIFLASSEVQQAESANASTPLTSHDVFCAVFPNLIVTFHSGRLISIRKARERLGRAINDEIDEGLHPTVEWILYSLLDEIIRQQTEVIELVESEAYTLDDLILSASAEEQSDFMHRITSVRRRCSYLQRELEEKRALLSALTSGRARRAVGGHEATLAFANSESGSSKYVIVGENIISEEDLFHSIFEVRLSADIRLHLNDVVSNIDSMQETLMNASDSINNTTAVYLGRVNIQLAQMSNELTQLQKFFAAISTIALPLGMITSAWGQNTGVPGSISARREGTLCLFYFTLSVSCVGYA